MLWIDVPKGYLKSAWDLIRDGRWSGKPGLSHLKIFKEWLKHFRKTTHKGQALVKTILVSTVHVGKVVIQLNSCEYKKTVSDSTAKRF